MIDVLAEVWKHSQAKGTDLCVALALGDWAAKDGISWHTQEEIAERTNCDPREVRRSIKELERLVEVEVRKVQRGRARINVYRVVVGKIGWRDVDYDRLPFTVTEPFSPPDTLSARRVDLARGQRGERPGATAPATTGRSVRPSDATTGGHFSPRRPDISVPDDRQPTRARVPNPPLNQELNPPPTGVSSEELEETPVPAAAGERASASREINELRCALVEALGRAPQTRSEHGELASAILQLREVGATPTQITRRVDRYRRRWPDLVVTATAIVKHWSLFGAEADQAAAGSGASKRSWVEKTSWQLPAEDAHWIVEDWPGIAPDERQALHDLVDQLRDEHAAASREIEAA